VPNIGCNAQPLDAAAVSIGVAAVPAVCGGSAGVKIIRSRSSGDGGRGDRCATGKTPGKQGCEGCHSLWVDIQETKKEVRVALTKVKHREE
jgi:hypothetical protein